MRNLSIATIFAALSGFAIVLIAPRILDVEVNAEFLAYWGLFFAFTGLIDGLMQETTRAVSAAHSGAEFASKHEQGRPLRFATLLGLSLGAIVLLTGLLWIGLLLSGSHGIAIGLLAAGVLAYTYQSVLSGLLSGLGLWNQYALLLGLDSGIRLLLVLIAWWAGWGLHAFFIITIIGAISWLVVLASSGKARAALSAPTDVSRSAFARNAFQAMLATGATAVLITGFPAFVKATADESVDPATGITVAGIIMAVTLTRAPILVPLQRFQSALIVAFVKSRSRVFAALAKPVGAVLGLGIVGAGLAWLVGPWIMDTLLGDGYHIPGAVLAILTLASAFTGILMITGTATIAQEKHPLYVLGWIVASLCAFGCLLLPFGLATTVCMALTLGPVTGAVTHLIGLTLGSKKAPATS